LWNPKAWWNVDMAEHCTESDDIDYCRRMKKGLLNRCKSRLFRKLTRKEKYHRRLLMLFIAMKILDFIIDVSV
jgi:rubrerythrin